MMECCNCKYWDPFPNDECEYDNGFCRINPPLIRAALIPDSYKEDQENAEDIGIEGIWPTTIPCEWCGGFKEK